MRQSKVTPPSLHFPSSVVFGLDMPSGVLVRKYVDAVSNSPDTAVLFCSPAEKALVEFYPVSGPIF